MTTLKTLSFALLIAAAALARGDKGGDKPADFAGLIVTDAAGKQHKLKSWKWSQGTRRLGWLASANDAPAKDKSKPKNGPAVGPEALVVREETAQPYVVGVTTFVPLERLRSIAFDNDRRVITVVAAGDDGQDVTLSGTTKYKNINTVTLEAEVDKGDSGVAEVSFLGGTEDGIRRIKFPASKVEAVKAGRPNSVQTADKVPTTAHKVADLAPLWRVGVREKTQPLLMFKKSLKMDVAKIRSVSAAKDRRDIVWNVAARDGEESTLTLLEEAKLDEQPAQFLGFVGRVPAGWKLFPPACVTAVHFGSAEEQLPPPETEDEKKDKE